MPANTNLWLMLELTRRHIDGVMCGCLYSMNKERDPFYLLCVKESDPSAFDYDAPDQIGYLIILIDANLSIFQGQYYHPRRQTQSEWKKICLLCWSIGDLWTRSILVRLQSNSCDCRFLSFMSLEPEILMPSQPAPPSFVGEPVQALPLTMDAETKPLCTRRGQHKHRSPSVLCTDEALTEHEVCWMTTTTTLTRSSNSSTNHESAKLLPLLQWPPASYTVREIQKKTRNLPDQSVIRLIIITTNMLLTKVLIAIVGTRNDSC